MKTSLAARKRATQHADREEHRKRSKDHEKHSKHAKRHKRRRKHHKAAHHAKPHGTVNVALPVAPTAPPARSTDG